MFLQITEGVLYCFIYRYTCLNDHSGVHLPEILKKIVACSIATTLHFKVLYVPVNRHLGSLPTRILLLIQGLIFLQSPGERKLSGYNFDDFSTTLSRMCREILELFVPRLSVPQLHFIVSTTHSRMCRENFRAVWSCFVHSGYRSHNCTS